jgi:nicotinamidase-related amidase
MRGIIHSLSKSFKATGRKKLIIAGIVTDVCVAFPTISALSEGYSVYVVVDASGTFNKSVRDAALMRMVHAGAILTSWFALSAELQRDWRNPVSRYSHEKFWPSCPQN